MVADRYAAYGLNDEQQVQARRIHERLRPLYEEESVRVACLLASWQQDAYGRTCAYVSVDAVSVPQQGPGGAKAEGRMAYVTKLYSPQMLEHAAAPPEAQVRYSAGFFALDDLGLRLRRQAAQVGWDGASNRLPSRTAAAVWRNSYARAFRWPSAFSISGTLKSIWWN